MSLYLWIRGLIRALGGVAIAAVGTLLLGVVTVPLAGIVYGIALAIGWSLDD